jgi:hypothetical protein
LFLFTVARVLALVASLFERRIAGPSTSGGGTLSPMLATLASFSGARDSPEHTQKVEDISAMRLHVRFSFFNPQTTYCRQTYRS